MLACQSGPLYLFVGGGLLHAPAEGLWASEARWAGQAVVARVCVLAPVLSVVVEAGIRHQGALWEKRQFASCLGDTATGKGGAGSLLS